MRVVYFPSFHLKNHQLVAIGETRSLPAWVDGLEVEIEYRSEDPDIVQIDQEGNVTGIAKGRGDITARALGKIARLTIDVYDELRDPVKNCAHMGLKSQAPENTLVSFRKAIENEFDIIECNLHITKDKKMICLFHNSLQPMYGIPDLVANYTYDEIKEKKMISGVKLYKYPDIHSPQLREVFELAKDSKIKVLAEFKDELFDTEENECLIKEAIDTIYEFGFEKRAILMTNNKNIIAKIKAIDPEIQVCIKGDNYSEVDIPYFKENNLMLFTGVAAANYNFLETLEKEGIKVIITLILDKDTYDNVKYWPVYAINSNFIFFDVEA